MGNMFQHRIAESAGKISAGVWHLSPIGFRQKLIYVAARCLMEGLVRWIQTHLNFSIEYQAGKMSFSTTNIQSRNR